MMPEIPEDARLEIKFVGFDSLCPHLLQWIRLNPAGFRTAYPDRRVSSIYFETEGYESYRECLEGSRSRVKVRYRWYGEAVKPAAGQLEVKLKRNYFGWKEKYTVGDPPACEGATWKSFRQGIRGAVPARGGGWLDSHPMPAVMNTYRRSYFVTPGGRIRVTVDTGHQAWDQRLGPGPSRKRRLSVGGLAIVEFKFARPDRDEASRVIQGFPLRVGAHSKYGTAIRAMVT